MRKPVQNAPDDSLLVSLLQNRYQTVTSINYDSNNPIASYSTNDNKYFQLGNKQINDLANQITKGDKTETEKMQDILEWVDQNIAYQSDKENYGTTEYWALPVQTINRRRGDCEDGAFLIQALGLAAGVNPYRLRTYGGLVSDGESSFSGHAWTTFQNDNADWVALDWCYYPTDLPINEREPIAEDQNYVQEYFYIDLWGRHSKSQQGFSFYV